MDIQTIAAKSKPIFEKNHVSYAAIFGSRARGDNRPDSDVDFIVHLPKGATLLTLARVQRELSERLKLPVDIVTERSIRPQLRSSISKNMKLIYDEKKR